MKLLPAVKKIEIEDGFLLKKHISPYCQEIDYRLKKAIDKLPNGENGANLIINTAGGNSEKYIIEIKKDTIEITSEGLNGAFYGIQTLRQLLKSEKVPCLYIEDEPDFEYRGLYHDITRGKVPKVTTLKKLIDDMAYFKMNSLQLYVEHVFEFKETMEIIQNTGYISKEEIAEIDEYCYENFIEFIPSIATFGHMYEILEQEQYKHLRVCKNVKTPKNFWRSRMAHHTIDPLKEESYALIKSLIDQYEPLFKSDKFNICGDETFDLENYGENVDTGKLYLDFVQKIIDYVKSKNKKVMMWADIILKYPEVLGELPEDIYYLNWDYSPSPSEENVMKLAKFDKKQIVCPGTSSWSRLCENVDVAEKNITRLIEYGYKHGAIGVLNTNWGDYANPASIELSMYGIVLGGVKSWSIDTKINDSFYDAVNDIVYGSNNAIGILKRLSAAHSTDVCNWNAICTKYFEHRYGEKSLISTTFNAEKVSEVQQECVSIINDLNGQKWENDEAREEMIICAEGICLLAQMCAKLFNKTVDTVVVSKEWLAKYREKWFLKNKESEISKIEEMVLYIDSI